MIKNHIEIQNHIVEYIKRWPHYEDFRNNHLEYIKGIGKLKIEYGIDYQFGDVIFAWSPKYNASNGILYIIDESNYGISDGSQNVWMKKPEKKIDYPISKWKWRHNGWSTISTNWGGREHGRIILPLKKIMPQKIKYINWPLRNPMEVKE